MPAGLESLIWESENDLGIVLLGKWRLWLVVGRMECWDGLLAGDVVREIVCYLVFIGFAICFLREELDDIYVRLSGNSHDPNGNDPNIRRIPILSVQFPLAA